MHIVSGHRTHARREVAVSVEALETRNLLSVGGTIIPPTLTSLEKFIVRGLDAYVNSHPGSLTGFEQSRQTLLTAINNTSTPSRVVWLDQQVLNIVDQVLIDHGDGGPVIAA